MLRLCTAEVSNSYLATVLYLHVTDFRVSLWSITDINSVLGLLHRAVVSDVPGDSELHSTSVFSVDPEEVGGIYLRNVGSFAHNHTA